MKRLPFAISVTIILAMSLYAWQGCTWYTHEILGAALPAGCALFLYGTETQPAFTIAAGCPGRDLVRLWPLPVQSPWFEDLVGREIERSFQMVEPEIIRAASLQGKTLDIFEQAAELMAEINTVAFHAK